MKKICLLVFTSKIARTLQRVIISTLLVNTFLVLTIFVIFEFESFDDSICVDTFKAFYKHIG
jgi:hypothetical protein